MKIISFTHKGKRVVNQDYILTQKVNTNSSLVLVADGMGGYEQGETAARIVADNVIGYLSIVENIDTGHVQKAINKANLGIRQYKDGKQLKMGSTVGGVIITGNKAICFWVGDVKIFYFRGKKLQFESQSHSLVNDLIDSGSITDLNSLARYKHIVTRSVHGDVGESIVDFEEIENADHEDLFIVCSDGVSDYYDGIQIQQLLSGNDPLESIISHIESRLEKEADDNYSLVAVEIN